MLRYNVADVKNISIDYFKEEGYEIINMVDFFDNKIFKEFNFLRRLKNQYHEKKDFNLINIENISVDESERLNYIKLNIYCVPNIKNIIKNESFIYGDMNDKKTKDNVIKLIKENLDDYIDFLIKNSTFLSEVFRKNKTIINIDNKIKNIRKLSENIYEKLRIEDNEKTMFRIPNIFKDIINAEKIYYINLICTNNNNIGIKIIEKKDFNLDINLLIVNNSVIFNMSIYSEKENLSFEINCNSLKNYIIYCNHHFILPCYFKKEDVNEKLKEVILELKNSKCLP